ncbi:hypothetical protein AKJ56_02005 [candidate division MSBL1 archaeon SCGC-AAA382N08]|uniref:Uncharacterized protein n=1 Tax=candidate division MSBL1 archaeon SCGC-AAA382N08 TaxID=1698285 RepID=A0A133VNL4_9EURY|nr:hypothetical protein AKJ56_02005 [candidate division MSBL1 archaeon SCGC-AAA382N08]
MGLRIEDVEEYDLSIEKREYSDRQLSRIDNMLEAEEITKEQAEFFKKNQRVELNALSPRQFVDFVERRLEEEGVEKVKPEEEDIEEPDVRNPEKVKEEARKKAVGSYVVNKARGKIIDKLDEEGVDYDEEVEEELKDLQDEGKEGIHGKVLDKLEDNPAKLWKEIMRDFVNERENEAERKEEKLDREVRNSVYNWCKENVDIDMKLEKN